MAKITVSSVAYVHADDIDPDKTIDAERVEENVKLCVARAIAVLDNPSNSYADHQPATIASLVRSMYPSHRAIRRVSSFG